MQNTKKRRALITGISGQDGSYLAELLLEKGYEVHGLVRRVAIEDPRHRMWRIKHLLGDIELHSVSFESHPSLYKAMKRVQPDECYHLAAESFVSYALGDEFAALNSNINGTYHVLSSIQDVCPQCRVYFAASSEMFGEAREVPQNEDTPFYPRSAYGISKTTGYHLARIYRDTYGFHITSGILFNHESPRRGHEFVTRKITHHVAQIVTGKADKLPLGNLEARRDWGHAADYVRAMWLMLQQDQPTDYVVATGQTHSVRQFCELAFSAAGLDYQDYVVADPRFFRTAEKRELRGDASKIHRLLGWKPSYQFEDIVKEMVQHDIKTAKENTPNPAS